MQGTSRTKHGVISAFTRMISPTSVLDVRASWTRYWENFPDVSDREFTWESLGIRTLPVPPNAVSKTPRVQMDNYQTILGGRLLNWSSRDQIDLAPTISQTRGRHQLKFGGEVSRIQRGTMNEGRSAGQFDFGRFWTQQWSGQAQGALDGYPVATMLLGLPTGGFIDYNDTYLRQEPYFAFFIQDDWKVSDRLTLNLGLRYDVQFGLVELHDRVNAGFAFDQKNPLSDQVLANWRRLKAQYDAANPRAVPYPDVPAQLNGGILFAGEGGQPRRVYDTDWTNIQPRIGVAWRFLDKTVLRAGMGVFHRTATQGNLTRGFDQQTPYQRSITGDQFPSACTSAGNCSGGPYSLENPFPNGLIPPSGSSLGLLTFIGRGIGIDGSQRVIPRTYQWSFGFERELPGSMVIEASYVGSRTVHEPLTIQMSDMSAQHFAAAQADPNLYNRQLPNPFHGVLPITSDFGAAEVINQRNLYRRYPLFNGVQFFTNPWGSVKYDALQIRFEKRSFERRASGALTWVVSYTFAKQLERALRNENAFEFQPLIWQLTDIDRPHQLSVSGVWDIPFGRQRHFRIENPVLNSIFGDWNANWVFTYYEGVPTGKPDAVYSCGDYRVAEQTRDRWFNNDRSCYVARPPFTFREVESRFSNIRNPAYGPQINVAIAKKFRFGERAEFELRGESFNVTNTPILSGPNTTFTDPQFGRLPIQQLNFPRQSQIGARIRF
jgi:hypothetical protein